MARTHGSALRRFGAADAAATGSASITVGGAATGFAAGAGVAIIEVGAVIALGRVFAAGMGLIGTLNRGFRSVTLRAIDISRPRAASTMVGFGGPNAAIAVSKSGNRDAGSL